MHRRLSIQPSTDLTPHDSFQAWSIGKTESGKQLASIMMIVAKKLVIHTVVRSRSMSA